MGARLECKGIEYSNGRCELWMRPEGIGATFGLVGFTCLRNMQASVFVPVEGGQDRACRGSTPTDNKRSYYHISEGVTSLEDCQKLCAERIFQGYGRSPCVGIEYGGDRCELWKRPVQSVVYLKGSVCMKFETPN